MLFIWITLISVIPLYHTKRENIYTQQKIIIMQNSVATKTTVSQIIEILTNNPEMSAVIGSEELLNAVAIAELQTAIPERNLRVINNGDHLLVY